nr:unnamed protein product [Callosobruchus analis]
MYQNRGLAPPMTETRLDVFFQNAAKSAAITGLNENPITRFGVILQALASGYDINLEFVAGTKDLYLNLYPWYYMPVTVHKLLMHSTKIITNCMVPIGQLSEEAQEARNKDSRRLGYPLLGK